MTRTAANATDVPTACVLCSQSCGLRVDVEEVGRAELTAAADRDPFTGRPHHKAVACRVTAAR